MITTYLLLQAALFLLSIGGFFQVRQFLSSSTLIASPQDLDRFKRMARLNMYVALVYMVLAIPGILMSMYLTFMYGLYGLGIVLAVSVPQFLFGKYLKSLEDKSRSLPCSSEFVDEHRRIGQSWLKKPLPDF
jgi:hypothetical protein